jgi:CO/xanthine dehydrogenase FAD-binding subunit
MDIKGIPELQGGPVFTSEGLIIPALTTHDRLERFPEVLRYYPALYDGVSHIGSVQTRMRGTLGGNICNAAPSGESLGPLLALDAVVTLTGPEGSRELPLGEFFPGAKKTVLQRGELLCSIRLPPPRPCFGSAYTKFGRRKAMDLALLGVSVCLGLDEQGCCDHVRIALTTAAPTPIRAKTAEEYLLGKALDETAFIEAGRLASAEAKPRSSWRAPAQYRRSLIETLLPRTAQKALARMKGSVTE